MPDCEICGRDSPDSIVYEVITDESDVRDDRTWYAHMDDFDSIEEGVVRSDEVYFFCPDCKPENPLLPQDERDDEVTFEEMCDERGLDV